MTEHEFEDGDRVVMKHSGGTRVPGYLIGDVEDGYAIWDKGEPVRRTKLPDERVLPVSALPPEKDPPAIELIETQAIHVDGFALVDAKGAVWRTFARPWWDIASWLWWWLSPGEKKWVQVRKDDGQKVRIRAVKLSGRHIRVGTPGKASGS